MKLFKMEGDKPGEFLKKKSVIKLIAELEKETGGDFCNFCKEHGDNLPACKNMTNKECAAHIIELAITKGISVKIKP